MSTRVYFLCGCTHLFGSFFFFNDTATTEIYTLSLHDALPICRDRSWRPMTSRRRVTRTTHRADRKSTRLNSSHTVISYAAFCLKNKKHTHNTPVGRSVKHAASLAIPDCNHD